MVQKLYDYIHERHIHDTHNTLRRGVVLNQLKRGLKKAVLVGTTVLSLQTFTGCPNLCGSNYDEPEYNNYAPTITTFYASPSSGNAPLESRLLLEGDDADGQNDIIESKIFADYNRNGREDAGEEIASVNDYKIDTNHTFNEAGDFDLYGIVTDSEGLSATKKISMSVNQESEEDYVDISGILQDNEKDTGRVGEIKVYDDRTDNLDGTFTYSNFLGETNSDSNGNFSLTLNKEVDANDKIYVRAVINSFDNPTSYIRTKELPAKDLTLNQGFSKDNPAQSVNNLYERGVMRCVPFDGDLSYDDNLEDVYENKLKDNQTARENFITHMRRVNFDASCTGRSSNEHQLKKWNYGEIPDNWWQPVFKGIEVSSDYFSEEQYQNFKNAVANSYHINASEIASKIERGTSHQYGTICTDYGWGEVFDINNSPTGGPAAITFEQKGIDDGYIERFVLYLSPIIDPDYQQIVNHETMHGLLFPGHASEEWTPKLFNSLMVYTSIEQPELIGLWPADIKANYLIDEPTYKGNELIGDILELE